MISTLLPPHLYDSIQNVMSPTHLDDSIQVVKDFLGEEPLDIYLLPLSWTIPFRLSKISSAKNLLIFTYSTTPHLDDSIQVVKISFVESPMISNFLPLTWDESIQVVKDPLGGKPLDLYLYSLSPRRFHPGCHSTS